MTALKAAFGAQTVLSAKFEYSILAGDTMLNTSGVSQNFKATGNGPFDVIPLPFGARVVSGAVTVKTAGDDSGAQTIAVGDSGSATRYLGATNIKAAALTALVPTGYVGTGEALRITLANANGDASTGVVEVRVNFVIDNRQTENLKTI